MEKRRVTLLIGGVPCGLYSDDSDEYLSALERRANAVMRRTARFSGPSASANAILSVLSLTDELLRTEARMREIAARPEAEENESEKRPAKALAKGSARAAAKAGGRDPGQVSVWDILQES